VLESQAIIDKALLCTLEGKAGKPINALTSDGQLGRRHWNPSHKNALGEYQTAAAQARLQDGHLCKARVRVIVLTT